jgi:hypothetical protein
LACAAARFLFFKSEGKPQFCLPLLRSQEMIANAVELYASELAQNVLVDNFIDRQVELPSEFGLGEQTKFQLLLVLFLKFTEQVTS